MTPDPTLRTLALVLVTTGMATTAATWTGAVFDATGRGPVSGAEVSIGSALAFTGSNGLFRLDDGSASVEGSRASWNGRPGELVLALEKSERIRLEWLDLEGRRLELVTDRTVGPGIWTWDVAHRKGGSAVAVLRLVRDGRSESWVVGPSGARSEPNSKAGATRRLAAFSDSLAVGAMGFQPRTVAAPAGGGAVDSIWLAPLDSAVPWNAKVPYGSHLDTRDGRTYRTVVIGGRRWFAQNLDYRPAGTDSGWCWEGNPDSCRQNGRLYTWKQAMAGAPTSSNEPSGVQGLCPSGWHIPSYAEWMALYQAVAVPGPDGTVLKATRGWQGLNGTDSLGFRALATGYRDTNGAFARAHQETHWWTSREAEYFQPPVPLEEDRWAHVWTLTGLTTQLRNAGANLRRGNPVRCAED